MLIHVIIITMYYVIYNIFYYLKLIYFGNYWLNSFLYPIVRLGSRVKNSNFLIL